MDIVVTKPILSNGREWVDSHGYIPTLEKKLLDIQKDVDLSEHNKVVLLKYFSSMAKKRPPTVLKNMQVVYKFLKDMGKDMGDSITKSDCDQYYINLINAPKLKPWTVVKYLLCIRRFFRVHYGLKPGRYPEQVDCWETNFDTRQYLDPDLMPSQDLIKAAIEKAGRLGSVLDSRNQFFISLINDIGPRVSEVLAVNIGDVTEVNRDGHDFLLVKFSQSKTFPRTVLSILSRPYLKKYFACRGITKDNISEKKNEPLFLDRAGERWRYRAVTKVIESVFGRVKYHFPKNRKSHLFRHVWMTRAAEYFNNSQRDYWTGQGTGKISSIYTHFNWKNVVKPYVQMLKEENNPMMLLKCASCGHENSGTEFCVNCGTNLTTVNAINKDDAVKIFKNFAQNMTQDEFDKYLLRLINKNRCAV